MSVWLSSLLLLAACAAQCLDVARLYVPLEGVEVSFALSSIDDTLEEAVAAVVVARGVTQGAGCANASCVAALIVREAHATREAVLELESWLVRRDAPSLLTLEAALGASGELKVHGALPPQLARAARALRARACFATNEQNSALAMDETVCTPLDSAGVASASLVLLSVFPGGHTLRAMVDSDVSVRCNAALRGHPAAEAKWFMRDATTGAYWKQAGVLNRTSTGGFKYTVRVGKGTYGADWLTVLAWGGPEELSIGAFSSIGPEVRVLLGGEHRLDWATTYPFPAFHPAADALYPDDRHATSKGRVRVGSDVQIGYGAILISGVTVGDGAVVGAGAVVAKDVAPYAVVVGNPAREIRRRFDNATIARLLEAKWWDWPDEQIVRALPLLLRSPTDALLAFDTQHNTPDPRVTRHLPDVSDS